jgi:hypothetical protein
MKTAKRRVAKQDLPKGMEERGNNFPSTWDPEVGDSLMGIVREYKAEIKTRTKQGTSDAVIVRETGTNLDWTVWISAGLKNRLNAKDKGKKIFLRRTDDLPALKKGRNPMKTFQVGVSK